MNKILKKLLFTAFFSRAILFFAQLVSHIFIENFDSSNTILITNSRNVTSMVNIFAGLNNWDAVYFNEVVISGYSYEQMLAFMPAYPFIVHVFVKWLCLSQVTILCIQMTTCFLNSFLFLVASYYLFILTRLLSNDLNIAYIATIAFVINPANIFFISSYSESLFVCVQFAMLYYIETKSYVLACILVNVTMVTRFNGTVNVAFLAYYLIKHKLEGLDRLGYLFTVSFMFKFTSYITLSTVLFVSWHACIYVMYCGQTRPAVHWCERTIPLSYPYIQEKYWNVGFFRYYEMKQIPNFVLASPIVAVIGLAINRFLQDVNAVDNAKYLGLFENKGEHVSFKPKQFVYLAHVAFLCFSGLTSFHVQILTRMVCSSSPIVYWTCADVLSNHFHDRGSKARFLITYFLMYNTLGLLLHCNFYPWT